MDSTTHHDQSRALTIIENAMLLMLAVPPLVILAWQLPRWAQGRDPTFTHPILLARSGFPSLLELAAIHPAIRILVLVGIGARLCTNYGWSVCRRYVAQPLNAVVRQHGR